MSQQDAEPQDAAIEDTGKMDLVSVLYVVGGIPAMVGFLVILFALGVPHCSIPG